MKSSKPRNTERRKWNRIYATHPHIVYIIIYIVREKRREGGRRSKID